MLVPVWTGEALYIPHNTEVRSCNHCCSGKEIIIMYPECVFVALVIQPEKLMHHIVICGLPGCTIFLDIISKMAGFSKKKCYWTWNVFFDFIIIFALRSSGKVLVICVRFYSNMNLLDRFSRSTDIKFLENPSSGGQVVPCRWTNRHDEANILFL